MHEGMTNAEAECEDESPCCEDCGCGIAVEQGYEWDQGTDLCWECQRNRIAAHLTELAQLRDEVKRLEGEKQQLDWPTAEGAHWIKTCGASCKVPVLAMVIDGVMKVCNPMKPCDPETAMTKEEWACFGGVELFWAGKNPFVDQALAQANADGGK